MVKPEQVFARKIRPHQMALILYHADKACIGGQSNVRSAADRQPTLKEDQVIGQIGQYAGAIQMFGSEDNYRIARYYANLYPEKGDGGADIPRSNIDFKASKMRGGADPLRYRLPVRPHERHENNVYFLLLVTGVEGDPEAWQEATVYFVGWASDSMLPAEPDDSGPFRGAYTIPASELNPIPHFHWKS